MLLNFALLSETGRVVGSHCGPLYGAEIQGVMLELLLRVPESEVTWMCDAVT